jgi:hypothetical protein
LQYSHTLETDSLANFVRQWLDFSDFFSLYFSEIQTNIKNSDENWLFWEKSRANIKEWHSRRTALRELLYLTGEDNLVLKIVHNWERLERQERYIKEGNYKTPFSFLLDFVNPVAMVNLHGDAVWIALQIAEEFIEILSWKYPKVKEILTYRYSSE